MDSKKTGVRYAGSRSSTYEEIPLALSEAAPEWEERGATFRVSNLPNVVAYWDDQGTAYIESAMRYAEVGRFQIFLLIICLIAYSATSTVPNILSQFSATIQCDYQLSLDDKKAINDVVYVCMVLGGVAWSILADTLSRKWTLIFALLVHSMSTIGLTLSTTFFWLVICRGLTAFSLSGITCITVVFIAEFQIRLFRGMPICSLQLAYVVAMVAIPSLPLTWKAGVLLGAVPPIVAAVGLMFFPDSPRFLLSRGRDKAAIKSLQMIHDTNTGTTMLNFPVINLIESMKTDNRTTEEQKLNSVVKPYIPGHLEPQLVCIPIIMLTQFVLMFSYYTLWMWFPHMVARTEAFFPLIQVEDIPQDCSFGNYYKEVEYIKGTTFSNVHFIEGDSNAIRLTSKSSEKPKDENPCNNEYRRRRYNTRSSTLDALACMPSIIWLVVKVDSIGRKFFITISHVVAGCLAFASYYMHNPGAGVIFSCLFDSVTLLSVAVSHCLAVELFPTRIRVLGVALVVGSGQLGAILADIGGAISFGLSCVVVVALIAIALAITGILTMEIPETTGIPLR